MKNTFRINENLIVDTIIRDFLSSNSCRISLMILSFQTLPEINFISLTDKMDTISYLPQSKLKFVQEHGLDPFRDGIGRINLKVGRLVYKLFPKKMIDQYMIQSDVEEFVNAYKAFFDISNRKTLIVKGEDIRKYYLDENYSMPTYGSLWKSCMRYYDRQKFLDLYIKNDDKISMLVVLVTDDQGVDRVRGRALLMEAEDLNGNKLKIMDRIYTIYDSDVYFFKSWARENGYISKFLQNAKSHNIFDVNGEHTIMDLKIVLNNHDLKYYPYLDTFPYYDGKGNFYNNHRMPYEYVLVQSNGSLFPPESDPVDDWEDDHYEPDFGEEMEF